MPALLLAALAGLLAVALILGWPIPRTEAIGVGGSGGGVHEYRVSGTHTLLVPAGVRGMKLEAVGGRGAGRGNVAGGRAARVEGKIETNPGDTLYVTVGGDAVGSTGGANGGGDGAAESIDDPFAGGGGGGASDVRTIPRGMAGSLESRIAVAAGGGGAGATSGSGKAGGAGGNAGVGGGRAVSAGPSNTVGLGGEGGASGSVESGGTFGSGGYPLTPGSGQLGFGGSAGGLGTGGAGGEVPPSGGAGRGGGGGAGLYGGGGAGGGGTMTVGPSSTGGGGGGGGSFLVPAGGDWSIEQASSEPLVTLKYTIPETDITQGPEAMLASTTASFQVESTEPGSSFECRLDDEPFVLCLPPIELSGLPQGPHRFEVRAVNDLDNFDASPARWEFAVDSIAPETRIDSGPGGVTEIKRPEFRFSSPDPEAEFSCRFDDQPFGPCAEPNADVPAGPLSIGAHTFSVRAADPFGNVGPVVTRTFEIVPMRDPGDEPLPPPPSLPRAAVLKLGGVKLNRKRGTGRLLVTVNGPGEIRLAASKRNRARRKAAGSAGSFRLAVKPKRRALKSLKRKRRVSLKLRVSFLPADGDRIQRSKRVVLKMGRKASKSR